MAFLLVCVGFLAHDSGARVVSTGFYNLARYQLVEGEDESADRQLRGSLRVHPENIEARYLFASRLYDKAKYSSAYSEYLMVWKDAPHFANVLYDLGICAVQMGRSDLALSWLARSKALNPYREGTLRAIEVIEDEAPPVE